MLLYQAVKELVGLEDIVQEELEAIVLVSPVLLITTVLVVRLHLKHAKLEVVLRTVHVIIQPEIVLVVILVFMLVVVHLLLVLA